MAAPTNTFLTGAAVGNRESLHDMISMLKVDEFPFQSAIGSGSATATYEEWQTDSLGTGSATNYNLEGEDSTAAAVTATTRVGNRTQIFKKVVRVSRTQNEVNKAGRTNELAYQTAKQAKQIKMDLEKTLTGTNQASNAESGSTPRKMGSVEAIIATNRGAGSGGSAGGFSSGNVAAVTDGTQRTYTEALLKAQIAAAWSSGGTPTLILMGPTHKQTSSGFTGIATQFQQSNNKPATSVAAIDVYVSDFGKLSFVPSRYMRNRTVIGIDPDYWELLWLTKWKREDLAKTGDSDLKHIVGEVTLKYTNEAANFALADLT